MAGNQHSGRKPLPDNLHLLHGNKSKLQLSRAIDSAQPPADIPEPGKHLDAVAVAEYHRIAPLLMSQGCITQWDKSALEVYCHSYSKWVRAVEKLNELKDCGLIAVTPKGFEQVGAWTILEGRYAAQMKSFAIEFGLTPSARTRVTPSPQLGLFDDETKNPADKARKYLDR